MVALQPYCLWFIDTAVLLFAKLISYDSLHHFVLSSSPFNYMSAHCVSLFLSVFQLFDMPFFKRLFLSATFFLQPFLYCSIRISPYINNIYGVEPSGASFLRPVQHPAAALCAVLLPAALCCVKCASQCGETDNGKREETHRKKYRWREKQVEEMKGFSPLFFVATGSCCSTMPINKPLPFGFTSSSILVWHPCLLRQGTIESVRKDKRAGVRAVSQTWTLDFTSTW